jgi:hypothetical protein
MNDWNPGAKENKAEDQRVGKKAMKMQDEVNG